MTKLTRRDEADRRVPNSLASYRDRIAKARYADRDVAAEGIEAARKDARKRKFFQSLPADFQDRIVSGELYIDQDEETGACAIYPVHMQD
jgi:ABC-type transport system involved in Fe-S cluster assembly fused permease/ATPase subunit